MNTVFSPISVASWPEFIQLWNTDLWTGSCHLLSLFLQMVAAELFSFVFSRQGLAVYRPDRPYTGSDLLPQPPEHRVAAVQPCYNQLN